MKRAGPLLVLLLFIFFSGAACWYWLHEDAEAVSPTEIPTIESPPTGNTNVAAAHQ